MEERIIELLGGRISKSREATLKRYGQSARTILGAIRQYPSAIVALGILLTFTFLAIAAPILSPYDPQTSFVYADGTPASLEPPSLSHPFGTTHLGRDVLSQWIYGSRVSLFVGFVSGFTVLVIGSTVGIVSGYYKGTVDLLAMRVVDILYGLPPTPLILVIALFAGPSVWNVIIAMGLVLWRTPARIMRSQTLSLAERPFVKSARASGASDLRIMSAHIAPNLLPLMFIEGVLVVSSAIVLEAGISFLGLGAQDVVSWGTMLQLTFATGAIRDAWWWVLPPGMGITLLVLSSFYLARVAEDITNPQAGRFE